MAENCYYIDYVADPAKGILILVAENLSKDDAERMVREHNETLEH